MSHHDNLPDNVTEQMIPGNRPEDIEADRAHEQAENLLTDSGPKGIAARRTGFDDLLGADTKESVVIVDALLDALSEASPHAVQMLLRPDAVSAFDLMDARTVAAKILAALWSAHEWMLADETQRILEAEE